MNRLYKTLFVLGPIGFLLIFLGTVIRPYAIRVYWAIDLISIVGLLGGFLLLLVVLFLLLICLINLLGQRRFKAMAFCIACSLAILYATAIIMPPFGVISPGGANYICKMNLERIGESIKEYSGAHNQKLPQDNWCDVLITNELPPLNLCCHGKRYYSKNGESSYAMNKYVLGLTLPDIPKDTVIIFETDFVGEVPDKTIEVKERASSKYVYFYYDDEEGKKLVREGAWNQEGDIEILTCSHHAGLGCNVLFADGHVEFVKKKDLPNLRWKP